MEPPFAVCLQEPVTFFRPLQKLNPHSDEFSISRNGGFVVFDGVPSMVARHARTIGSTWKVRWQSKEPIGTAWISTRNYGAARIDSEGTNN